MPTSHKPRIYYGYIIVIVSFFISLLAWGTYSTFGVFFEPIRSEFGWSRAMISGPSSLTFFLIGTFSILTGRLTDRFGPRRLVIIYGIIIGIGYALISRISSLWQLYVFYGLAVGFGTSCADASLLPTTARWFVKNRGIMSGVVKAGTGAGMFILPTLSTWLILNHGWRYAYLILAGAIAVGIAICASFLRRDPSEKGLEPYGISEKDKRHRNVDFGYTLRQALHSKVLWITCAVYFMIWYATQSVIVHIVPHSLDLKMSPIKAAGILSLIGAASLIGRLVIGGTLDRIGSRRALILALCLLVSSLAWLLIAEQTWMLYLFVPVYGFAHGGFFTLMSPLIGELFGIRSHGSIFGILLFVGQSGGAIGPLISGHIFDVTGSYQVAFTILFIASVVGLILSFTLKPGAVLRTQQP
ncbi:MAG: MFS transporter [Chloroflexota bacterium]